MHFPQILLPALWAFKVCFSIDCWRLCKLRNTTDYCWRSLGAHSVWQMQDYLSWGSETKWFQIGMLSEGDVAQCKSGITDVCFRCPKESSAQLNKIVWWLFYLCLQWGSLERAEILQCWLVCSRTCYFFNFRLFFSPDTSYGKHFWATLCTLW